jgi:hypothetical protein
MRIALALFSLISLTLPQAARAQDAETQAVRADIQAERTKLVAANLELTETEGKAFWPLYTDYRAQVSKLDDRTVALLRDYSDNYDAMTDEKAKGLLQQLVTLDDDRLKLRRSYIGKFEKVLPSKKVARYFQIERKLDAAVAYEAATAIPLVK